MNKKKTRLLVFPEYATLPSWMLSKSHSQTHPIKTPGKGIHAEL
jgi:hypothetical protein